MTGQSSYMDQMYSQWKADPTSVDETWQKHFQSVEGGAGGAASTGTDADI